MGRDGTIGKQKLNDILSTLPDKCRIGINHAGNIMVWGQDRYLGYIDMVEEKFFNTGKDIHASHNDSGRGTVDAVSRGQEDRDQEGQSTYRVKNDPIRVSTYGSEQRVFGGESLGDVVRSPVVQGGRWAPKGFVEG